MTAVTDFLASRFEGHKALRRDIHAHPELGFKETRTAALIAERLRAAGYEVVEGVGTTGLVATLSRGAGPTIGLRADMDALPMDEETNLPHASKTPGVFHGCGHDGHTVSLLATAEALAAEGGFSGTLRMIFQPAEEGLGGGLRMIEEGLFERFPCDLVYGFHNMPLLPLGTATVRPGPAMASADEFKVTFTGKGGHAAMPHLSKDCALALSELTVALQRLVARGVDPLRSAVLSVTQIHVGQAHNVIAGSGWLGGTVRTLGAEERDFVEAGMHRLAKAVALAHEMEVEVTYTRGYPPLVNDSAVATRVAEGLRASPVVEMVEDVPPIMAAEDFAYMLEKVPGAYLNFGMAKEGEANPMVHNPAYDFRDELIPVIAATMVELVRAELPET
ncbi:amidohydrolase [Pseudooceanicola nanhaiensis]|uniref:amidohydrolase n=1 Tax=Pseudooceanicola nanhaiensis TaxID=375761 RepID=UPI001CD2D5A2|nr:amidohydrolase [Pseudooceanicola nanhaiensis]MCA0921874.1 amidohydrolase [Pseudooceanicola nanhaiensis]